MPVPTSSAHQRNRFINKFETEQSGEFLDTPYEREDEFPTEITRTPEQLRDLIIDQQLHWNLVLSPQEKVPASREIGRVELDELKIEQRGEVKSVEEVLSQIVFTENKQSYEIPQDPQHVIDEVVEESSKPDFLVEKDKGVRVDFSLLKPVAGDVMELGGKVLNASKEFFGTIFEMFKKDILGIGAKKKEKQETDPEKIEAKQKAEKKKRNKLDFFNTLKSLFRGPSKEQKQQVEAQQISIAEALGINNSFQVMENGQMSAYHQAEYDRSMSEAAKMQKKREQQIKDQATRSRGFDANLLKAGENMSHFTRNAG